MPQRRALIMIVTSAASVALACAGLAGPARAAGQGAAAQGVAGQGGTCSAGAHTLSSPACWNR